MLYIFNDYRRARIILFEERVIIRCRNMSWPLLYDKYVVILVLSSFMTWDIEIVYISVIIACMKHTITFIIPAIVISERTIYTNCETVPTKVQGTNLFEDLKDVITDMYVCMYVCNIIIKLTKFMWVTPNKKYVWFLWHAPKT